SSHVLEHLLTSSELRMSSIATVFLVRKISSLLPNNCESAQMELRRYFSLRVIGVFSAAKTEQHYLPKQVLSLKSPTPFPIGPFYSLDWKSLLNEQSLFPDFVEGCSSPLLPQSQ